MTEVALPPGRIAEPMPDKRDPFEPRYHYRGQHIIFLSSQVAASFIPPAQLGEHLFFENTVAGLSLF